MTPELKKLVSRIDSAITGHHSFQLAAPKIETVLQKYILCTDLLTEDQTACSRDGYTRHLLHRNADAPYTIMSLVWRPGQASPVHGHNAWCVVGVVKGTLTIESYSKTARSKIYKTKTHVARSGETGVELPHKGNIHRIINDSDEKAVSLHLYGMDLADDPCQINETYDNARSA